MRRGKWLRVTVVAVVLAAVGVGGVELVASAQKEVRPIRVGTTDTVTSLDPAGAYDAGSWALFSNVYQSLLTYSRGTTAPVPDAAQHCGFVGHALTTYRCELREDARFADGREMTARDVKYSFDRIRRIASPQGPAPLLATLKDVTAEGRRVTFRLSAPDATFPFKIATGAGSIVDSKRYPADRLIDGAQTFGSGPYALQSYEKGRRAELRPNVNYEGAIEEAGQPVSVRYYPDPADLSRAWHKSQVEVVGRQLTPDDVAPTSPPGPDVRVTENADADTRSMVFNLRPGSPMAKREVRQAIAAVMDRPTLSRRVYQRTVEPLYSLIPQGIDGHSTAFFERYPKPDPDAARALLEKAGVSIPVRFDLAYSQGSAVDYEATELRRQLEASGLFKVHTQRYEWTEFQKGYAKGAYDAYCVGWLADFPDPETFTQSLVGSGGTLHSGYRSAYVDQLLRNTEREPERGRTRDDFRALQKRIAQDVPLVPLWQRKGYVLSKVEVSGTEYLADGTGLWRLWKLTRS
ncbi:ABC transporter substrate-binding protein [Streptomyces sp. NPDC101393]|uniref:ABC transporter substrate-binding protein n=1 Tax=Streptomyces sp. NPDC101393 TaxID=3366141 RepID=UPI003825383B